MKKLITTTLIVILLTGLMTAYADDETRPKWRHKGGFFRGGAGGFELMILKLDVPALNEQLKNIGVPALDDMMILTGGGGWAFLGKGIRVGGYGFGGFNSKSAKPGEIQKEVTLSVGLGGMLVEKVFHPFNNSELYIGTGFGGGGMSIDIVQWSGPKSWKEIWDGFSIDSLNTAHSYFDYDISLSNAFFYVLPTIGFRYNVFRWFAIGINVNYLYCWNDKWKHKDKIVTGVPEIDLSNISYRLNFYFGG
ncbi:MAG: hypothetical protein H0Z29_01555 [Candidatus Marinimicrobia bacterium]|nr:hypothetical protein [Candidatus Neomarinimicrobiota bacterium]